MCVEIEERKGGYRLETAVWLPREIADVFAFFSETGNLNLITPEWICFRIQTPLPLPPARIPASCLALPRAMPRFRAASIWPFELPFLWRAAELPSYPPSVHPRFHL